MSDLLTGFLSALLATNQPAALSNLVQQKTGLRVEVTDPNDPVEQAYQKLLLEDDDAQAEVERWRAETAQSGTRSDVLLAALEARVRDRFQKVQRGYVEFLAAHPKHANARIAYASFLNETGEEEAGAAELDRVLQLDPKNPAALNNLANFHGHAGDVKKAFDLYARAIAVATNESLYYQNFATTVFLFRKDAMEFYKIDEQGVFAKAMALYRRALELDPNDFLLASEVAQTHYGIILPKLEDPAKQRAAELNLAEEALAAWRKALVLAQEGLQREGVLIHLARWQGRAGRLDEARQLLDNITNQVLAVTKERVLRHLGERETRGSTNRPPAAAPANSAPPNK